MCLCSLLSFPVQSLPFNVFLSYCVLCYMLVFLPSFLLPQGSFLFPSSLLSSVLCDASPVLSLLTCLLLSSLIGLFPLYLTPSCFLVQCLVIVLWIQVCHVSHSVSCFLYYVPVSSFIHSSTIVMPVFFHVSCHVNVCPLCFLSCLVLWIQLRSLCPTLPTYPLYTSTHLLVQ